MRRPTQEKVDWIAEHIRSQVLPSNPDPAVTAFIQFLDDIGEFDHRIRFVETFIRTRRFAPQECAAVYETGTPSAVTQFYNESGFPVGTAKGDFRYRIELPDKSADMLWSFEVFEHIKDQDSKNFDDIVLFNFSGVRCFIDEMYRVLRPGGKVLLTTPNLCSMHSLAQILEGINPFIFYPHVKEYAPRDVIAHFSQGGFGCTHFEAFTANFFLNEVGHLVKKYFSDLGFPTENRGDTAFFVFEKSAAPNSEET